ncbi:uncharacterized protein LTR77_006951 [Saxophila tyrrhenica]|uniref:Uncharacterized protein n=1 Tax=Saxophila tyrrhenica TaxID=1690608 RepID=A0AAV9P6W4_9PEZI|nr:hypothetical protein LTR77_006951 [Saxophila tyrrhenica]
MAALRPEDAMRSEADTKRPIITHLTADNSWLIQLPRSSGDRMFFNIVLDPWLTTNQIEFATWVHDQAHTEMCAAQSFADVERFCGDVERLARKFRSVEGESTKPTSYIDAVALSLAKTDHVHQETLLQLPPSVPIFCYGIGTASMVKSWKYFETVIATPDFIGNWEKTSIAPLPKDIGISAIQSRWDISGLHPAQIISWQPPGSSQAECIMYTPHGILPTDISALVEAEPPVKVLALLHGCLRVGVGFRYFNTPANLGARNGLEVSRLLKSQYWIHTHDERKVEKGLTSWILVHDWQKLDDVAEEYAKKIGEEKDAILKQANFHDLGNGGSLVLV